jgi:hypothetical protein
MDPVSSIASTIPSSAALLPVLTNGLLSQPLPLEPSALDVMSAPEEAPLLLTHFVQLSCTNGVVADMAVEAVAEALLQLLLNACE